MQSLPRKLGIIWTQVVAERIEMVKIKAGNVEEFTHDGVTGVCTRVEVAGLETWSLGCLRENHLIEMEDDLKERYTYKQGRWDGDWLNQDPQHIEFMQKLLTAAHEKLLPYVNALRANDDDASAQRTPD